MIYNSESNVHTQYINALINVYKDEGCSWAVDGKRMEVLEKTMVDNFPNFEFYGEETFEFEYESVDELKDMEDGHVYSVFMEVDIITTRDYWGEYDTEIDIKQFKYRDVTEIYEAIEQSKGFYQFSAEENIND